MISCIVLAAGLSQRFGSLKALAQVVPHLTVIEYLQRRLFQTKLDEIIIVLGHQKDAIKPRLLKHSKLKVVYNKDYNFGQTSSFKAGVAKVSDQSQGLMLLPVDCPLITPQTIDFLIDSFQKEQSLVLVPTFQNRHGHPPIFSSQLKTEILALDNGVGLNTFIHKHENDSRYIEVKDNGVLKTFNTKDEFESLRKDFV